MPILYLLIGVFAAWTLRDKLAQLQGKLNELKLLPPKSKTLMDRSKELDEASLEEQIAADRKQRSEKSAFADARAAELSQSGIGSQRTAKGEVIPDAVQRSEQEDRQIYRKWIADNMNRNVR